MAAVAPTADVDAITSGVDNAGDFRPSVCLAVRQASGVVIARRVAVFLGIINRCVRAVVMVTQLVSIP